MQAIFFIIAIALMGCKSPDPIAKSDSTIDQLVYKFHDSSVPPQYHRSFEITITADSIKKRVHSYSETISIEAGKCTPEDFKAVQEAFESGKIKNCKRPDDGGCTGGTEVSILTFKDGEEMFKGYRSDCGGGHSGTMCGDTDAVLKALNLILMK